MAKKQSRRKRNVRVAKNSSVRTDVILKDFWRQNERFADLFNAVVFQGKEILTPELLQEMDTDMSGIIRFKDYDESIVRVRDVVKKMAFGVEFAVLGIENQMKAHYAMPLRTMLYDGLGYLKEYQEVARARKKETGMTKEEFLSGMRREDRLHPIITIVICYSETLWDGPMCIKDMMIEMPEELENIFSDYKMNLVQVLDSENYIFHNEDVRTVFEISREIFKGNFDKINDKYKDREIESELISVIGKITDSVDLINEANKKEVTSMCTALEKLKEDSRNEGRRDLITLIKHLVDTGRSEDLVKITDSVDLINEADKKEVTSMCTALEKLKEDSRNEGREAERRELITLMKRLVDTGRSEDLVKITTDEHYLQKVMEEFNLV